MRCPDCEHENTAGAWLCINCGMKLPRPEDAEQGATTTGTPAKAEAERDEPSRLAPQISENLRKLRERTERERTQNRSPERRVSIGGRFLGLPLMAWGVIIFLFVVFAYIMSSLQ